MPDEPTMREHLEAIRDRHTADRGRSRCNWCQYGHPCPDYADAVAALDQGAEIAPLLVDIHTRASRAYTALPLAARIERDDLAQSIQDVEAALSLLVLIPDPERASDA